MDYHDLIEHRDPADATTAKRTYLVFYREGEWDGCGSGPYTRRMPTRWETGTLLGDSETWEYWNRSGVREYKIVASTSDPVRDKEFQFLVAVTNGAGRPAASQVFFGTDWIGLRKLTVAQVRAMAADTNNRRSPLARELVATLAVTQGIPAAARQLLLSIDKCGLNQRGVAKAEKVYARREQPEIKRLLMESFPEFSAELLDGIAWAGAVQTTASKAGVQITRLAGMRGYPPDWSTAGTPEWLHPLCSEMWAVPA